MGYAWGHRQVSQSNWAYLRGPARRPPPALPNATPLPRVSLLTPLLPSLPFPLDRPWPHFVAGRAELDAATWEVPDRARGGRLAQVAQAGPADVERAIAAAAKAHSEHRPPAHVRKGWLERLRARVLEHAEDLAQLITLESGKPLKDSRAEVSRAATTLELAAELCAQPSGGHWPLDGTPAAEGYRAIEKRVPVGPVALITPFNFPLNLVAHKLGPALAAGCPFVLKPAAQTPLSALVLIAWLHAEPDLPPGFANALLCDHDAAAPLVEDPRLRLLSFTGSDAVGWQLRGRAVGRRVCLELGGNAACIVDRDADLKHVVERLTAGAFAVSGQSCISVQRVFVHRDCYTELKDLWVARVQNLRVGAPLEPDCDVGPLIDRAAAERLSRWISAAQSAGAKLLTGGELSGQTLQPTLLENVPEDADLWSAEAFGPVACLTPFDDLKEAFGRVNRSPFGLQAGLFTSRLEVAMDAWDHLEVGGVVVGDVPSVRFDAMPYGGVKRSGLGREGLRSAIEEFTEPRLLLIRG